MSYYCSVSDKTIELKSKNKQYKSLTQKEHEKFFQINRTIQNPIFFGIDKVFNDYVTNHNKKFELFLVRTDFILDFDNDLNADIKTDFHFNISPINLKRYILYWFAYFF